METSTCHQLTADVQQQTSQLEPLVKVSEVEAMNEIHVLLKCVEAQVF